MKNEDQVFLQNIAFLSFASALKGVFCFKNFIQSSDIKNFVDILAVLGQDIKIESNTLTLQSHGAFHLFEPEEAIDIKGSIGILYALIGLFSAYDYSVTFIDSTKKLKNFDLHPLILTFSDIGIRFQYSNNFTLPLTMKGTSNFLPMQHEVKLENAFLELSLINLGLHGMGKTEIKSDNNYGFNTILKVVNANFTHLQNRLSVALHPQNFTQTTETDLQNYDKI